MDQLGTGCVRFKTDRQQSLAQIPPSQIGGPLTTGAIFDSHLGSRREVTKIAVQLVNTRESVAFSLLNFGDLQAVGISSSCLWITSFPAASLTATEMLAEA